MADEAISNVTEQEQKKAIARPTAEAKAPRSQKKAKSFDSNIDEQLLFEKYSYKDVVVGDQSLAAYINLVPKSYPNVYGRGKRGNTNVIERLMNKLMRGGTGHKVGGHVIRTEGKLQGKKLKVMHIVEDALGIVAKTTNKNPLQVLVNALERAAPIEDTTRVRYGGISYNVAVDISSVRRVNVAINNLAFSAIIGAFKNRRSLSEALANELILAANSDPSSYAIKKRVESERMARSAR
ncbi:MAG: 30S ribosomal protein S7 [Candidatus Micrarchaeota archaeon]|nr:30S ribosomal protein S7 [Candidatus Micrarchaeota archaeon]MDE1848358.1 30S ribosomal protein S7 [Candidatus Micrarchaeota archaeon]MDE1864957.1 30S ribosomal protein S7 [Candidatus Micrarchaeota archaeon]